MRKINEATIGDLTGLRPSSDNRRNKSNGARFKSKQRKPRKVTITQLKEKDIWSDVIVPFEDDYYGSKARPIIILDTNENVGLDGTILIMMVTSIKEKERNRRPSDVELKDWKEEGLKKPSYARTDRIEELGIEFFLPSSRKWGKVTDNDWIEILKLARRYDKYNYMKGNKFVISEQMSSFLKKINDYVNLYETLNRFR